MNLSFTDMLNLSILLAAIISAARIRVIEKTYIPFFILVCTGAVNEILSIYLMQSGYHTILNNNVYVLLEAVLILRFFAGLARVTKDKKGIWGLLCSVVILWVCENFLFGDIRQIGIFFRIYYSFIVVLLSINRINYLLFRETGSLLKSPSFLICLCFIIFFTYKILVEAFWIYGLSDTRVFRNSVYTLLVYINLAVNLVFAIVAVWVPKKQTLLRWP